MSVTITREQAEAVKAVVNAKTNALDVFNIIDRAIDSLVADPAKPEHYEGEPCNFPVHPLFIDEWEAIGKPKFVYARKRLPCDGEWYVSNVDMVIGRATLDFQHDQHWILRPVPIEKPKPEPRITVLTFDREGKQGSYAFRGKPDWARIEREMVKDGYMAVIVKGAYLSLEGNSADYPHTALFVRELNIGLGDAYRYCKTMNAELMTRWDYYRKESLAIAINRIRKAIEEWRAKPPLWTPKVGERAQWDGVGAEEPRMDAGEVIVLRHNGEDSMWFESWGDSYDIKDITTGRERSVRTAHLSPIAVEDKLQWKVGDWANYNGSIVQVSTIHSVGLTEKDIRRGAIPVKFLSGIGSAVMPDDLRPLTAADWTREYCGHKVRAYELQNGRVAFIWLGIGRNYFDKEQGRALCAALGLPIMPHSLNQGNYVVPEE